MSPLSLDTIFMSVVGGAYFRKICDQIPLEKSACIAG